MSFNTTWNISGTSLDKAGTKFVQSSKKAISNLKKHEDKLNKLFKEHINANMQRSGIDADNFADVFMLKIDKSSINFVNTEPLVTQRYEYGYYNGSNDTNEEYYEEYMIQTSPRYFIRPSIQESLNDIGQTLLNEAKQEYNNQ